MHDKRQILKAIATVAEELGRTPTLLEFTARSGISRHYVSLIFAKWNDAVRAADLEPLRLKEQLEDAELLRDWGLVVRQKRRIPTQYAYWRQGKHNPRTLQQRFGGWSAVPEAFRKFAMRKPEWADVVGYISRPSPAGLSQSKEKGRPSTENLAWSVRPKSSSIPPKEPPATAPASRTYGNPMHFPGFRHEPVNEQGVILLFGMVARELGYMIEAVQSGFPDCEAKRQIAPSRWQRVNIEFEFESRNFRDHGHPVSGCDVIVCWRHNWDDCPDHVEVLELCTQIKSLANSED